MTRAASLAVEIFTGFSVAPARRKNIFQSNNNKKKNSVRESEKKLFFLFIFSSSVFVVFGILLMRAAE